MKKYMPHADIHNQFGHVSSRVKKLLIPDRDDEWNLSPTLWFWNETAKNVVYVWYFPLWRMLRCIFLCSSHPHMILCYIWILLHNSWMCGCIVSQCLFHIDINCTCGHALQRELLYYCQKISFIQSLQVQPLVSEITCPSPPNT